MNVDSVEILGVHFDSEGKQTSHTSSRTEKCHQAFYSPKGVGLGYPGCHTHVKSYLWKTSCSSFLHYDMDCITNDPGQIKELETCQGSLAIELGSLQAKSRRIPVIRCAADSRHSEREGSGKEKHCKTLPPVVAKGQPGPKRVLDLISFFVSDSLCNGSVVPGSIDC